ncbi:MAG: hypothetical protein KAH01_03980 [Caldisericia bacterium]|nr:hypothetical protein [Caldisericia bacterium]
MAENLCMEVSLLPDPIVSNLIPTGIKIFHKAEEYKIGRVKHRTKLCQYIKLSITIEDNSIDAIYREDIENFNEDCVFPQDTSEDKDLLYPPTPRDVIESLIIINPYTKEQIIHDLYQNELGQTEVELALFLNPQDTYEVQGTIYYKMKNQYPKPLSLEINSIIVPRCENVSVCTENIIFISEPDDESVSNADHIYGSNCQTSSQSCCNFFDTTYRGWLRPMCPDFFLGTPMMFEED